MPIPIDWNVDVEPISLDEMIATFERDMVAERRNGPNLVPTCERIKKCIRADPSLDPEDAEKLVEES